MAKASKQARASSTARAVVRPRPARVEILVKKTGRTMRCSPAEARALVALRIAEYIVTTPPAQVYETRVMTAYEKKK